MMTRKPKGASLASASPDIFTPIQASSQNLTLSFQAILDFFSLSSSQVANTFVSSLQQLLDSFGMTTNNITATITGMSNQLANSFSSGQTGYGNTGNYYY